VAGVLEGWLDRGSWQRAEASDFLLDLANADNALSEMALWELPWNRLQKPLACPAKPLKTLEGVLNPVLFLRQFPGAHPLIL
jgi:hypothetical protein